MFALLLFSQQNSRATYRRDARSLGPSSLPRGTGQGHPAEGRSIRRHAHGSLGTRANCAAPGGSVRSCAAVTDFGVTACSRHCPQILLYLPPAPQPVAWSEFPRGFNSEGSCQLPRGFGLGFFFSARAITARWDAAFALPRLQLPAVPGEGRVGARPPQALGAEATHSSLRWPPGEVQRRARATGAGAPLALPTPAAAAAAAKISP